MPHITFVEKAPFLSPFCSDKIVKLYYLLIAIWFFYIFIYYFMRRNGKANCYMVNIARGCVTFFFFFFFRNKHTQARGNEF